MNLPGKPTLAQIDALKADGESLDLRGSDVTELPEGMVILGSLDLRETSITRLPEWLFVRGHVNLSESAVREIGGWLMIGGMLNLSHTAVCRLPETIAIGGPINLNATPIPVIHTDVWGSDLRRVRVGQSGEWFVAGTRRHTSRAEALAYWNRPPHPLSPLKRGYLDAIEAQPIGWPEVAA